jgi:hypothetical protein
MARWEPFGFEVVGRLPGAEHPREGFVDAGDVSRLPDSN